MSWGFLSSLFKRGHEFFNFFKGGHLKTSLGNPGIDRFNRSSKLHKINKKQKKTLVLLRNNKFFAHFLASVHNFTVIYFGKS